MTGEYDQTTDEQAIRVTHGYSKDNPPDLRQVVQELIVSQDGGIPLLSKSWDGSTEDRRCLFGQSNFGDILHNLKQKVTELIRNGTRK